MRINAIVLLVLAFVGACASPPSDGRSVETLPDQAAFDAVQPLILHRCGTLDCHGQIGRSLRVFGATGLRYSANDRPSALVPTTADEIAQTYDSVVGLEPEIMSAVVAAAGANPERLTFVRKARGTEEHKGGTVVTLGDDQDECITTWLAGRVDSAACARGLSLP